MNASYDWLRRSVRQDLDRERALCHRRASWLLGGELGIAGLYGFCLQKLGEISAQEPMTYPKESVPVSSLAWFTAWALPALGLGLAVVMMWLIVASLLNMRQVLRHWRAQEGLAASSGQRHPGELYAPVRGGNWGLLLLPVMFLVFWFSVVRTQSHSIQDGIENWRQIPQDQA